MIYGIGTDNVEISRIVQGFDSQLSFHHIEISKNEKGKPYFLEHPFAGQAHLSISHSNLEAVAMVVLESKD